MKKKIALIVCFLFLMSSAAMASPLSDYSQGKVSVDLNYRYTKNTGSDGGESIDFDKRWNLEPSVTMGLGNKWAFQYRGVNSKSKNTTWFDGTDTIKATTKLTVNEFNALYQLTPNISGFAGYVSAKGTVDGWESGYGSYSESDKRNTWQLGLVGYVPLADKFTAYGVVGAGSKWTNYEIGLSYAITKSIEFNVDYRDMKAKDLNDFDLKAKGIGFGVTCKF